MRIRIVFILIASHLSSHCNRGLEQLGNGLLLQNSLKRDGSLWFASSPLIMKNDEGQKMATLPRNVKLQNHDKITLHTCI